MKLSQSVTVLFWLAVLVSPAIGQDLAVTVQNAVASKTQTTRVTEQLNINGVVTESTVSEKTSAVSDVPIAVLKITSPAPKLRVKSRTGTITALDPNEYAVSGGGTHLVEILALGIVNGELFFEETEVTVTVGGPVPPIPPQPPQPSDDAPIQEPGLRVLIVVETQDLTAMPESQKSILYSTRMRDYLNANCVINNQSMTHEWRILDQDIEFPVVCDSVWCKTMARPRTSIPWIVISNGTTGFEGPLPLTVDETISLIERYKQ